MLNEEQRREIAAYINAAPDRIERARRKRAWYAQLNMAGPDALRRAFDTKPCTTEVKR